MKAPKYDVGDVFYGTYCLTDSVLRLGDGQEYKIIDGVYIPSLYVIAQIIIDKNAISYKVNKWYGGTKQIAKREILMSEEELNNFHPSSSSLISDLSRLYEKMFEKLTEQFNKEKLKDALHGK
jgi:hypothetical protein